MTPFQRIGEERLRAIIDEFVDRVFEDAMIGFMFRNADRARIKRFEYQHAAEHLGAGVAYEGRSLRSAHAPHRIQGGQFGRRSKILRDVLEAHGVEADIVARWMAHLETLRPEITAHQGDGCA